MPEQTAPPANLDALLQAELDAVQAACEQHGGKAALARFLSVRPEEISRYFTNREGYARQPSGKILAGMREFLRQHTAPNKSKGRKK